MAEERTLQWWKDAVRSGLRFQLEYAHSNMWAQYKSYYRHEFPDGTLPVNLIFSHLRSMVPQVYFRNPAVSITATKPGLEHELHARLVEDVDNWLLRELSTKYEIKKMITDAFLCGTATGFVGYDSEYGYSKDNSLGGEDVATLTQYDKSGKRIEYKDNVIPGMPWFLRARPEDTIYPWGCESAASAPWVALRVFRPLKDIKKDAKYSNIKDLNGSYTQKRTTVPGGITPYDREFPQDIVWVELWQVRDKKTGKILVFTMDHDKFLRNDPDPMQIEGLPIESISFNPDPDFVYGIPDARIIEPQLLELNEIRTQAMKHRRIDILKFLYTKGSLQKDQLDKLLSEDVQAAVAVEADASIRDSIMPFNPGASGILSDLQAMGEVIRGDVREAVGFSRAAAGEYQGKTHIAAKETEVVQGANQVRLDERRDAVADLLTNIVRRFNQIIFTHWKQPMVRNVVGPDGAQWWLRFSPSDIRGEYNIKVDPTNAVPVDPTTRKQDAVEMAQAYAQMNAGQISQGAPIPAEIQRYFFSQFEGFDVDRLLAQAGGQQQQQGQPGGNQGQPVPPGQAAQMMQQQRGA